MIGKPARQGDAMYTLRRRMIWYGGLSAVLCSGGSFFFTVVTERRAAILGNDLAGLIYSSPFEHLHCIRQGENEYPSIRNYLNDYDI